MLTDFFKVIPKGSTKSENKDVPKKKEAEQKKRKEEIKEEEDVIEEKEEEIPKPEKKRLRRNVIIDDDDDDDDIFVDVKEEKKEEEEEEMENKKKIESDKDDGNEDEKDDAIDECEKGDVNGEEEEEKPKEGKEDDEDNEMEEDEGEEIDDEDEDEDEDEDGYSSGEEKRNESENKSKSPTAPRKAKTTAKKKDGKKYAPIKYDVVADAGFKKGEDVPYLVLAQTFEKIEGTTLRLEKTEYLANLFRSIIQLTPRDLLPAIYLIIGKVAPDYMGIELGIGDSLLIKAVSEATGTSQDQVKRAIHTLGDLGRVASTKKQRVRSIFPPPPLTVKAVYAGLKEIATSSGTQSRDRKAKTVTRLMVSCRECEPQYIVRMLQGKFRIGCSEKTVLAALARALVLSPPAPGSGSEAPARRALGPEALAAEVGRVHNAITTALSLVPCYDDVVPILLEPGGIETLGERCRIRPGMPVHPMLAQPTKGVGEVLNRLEKVGFTCEYKYDGERAQIHVFRDAKTKKLTAKVYSRNLEESSAKFPDVILAVLEAAHPDVESCIIDSEAVGWDPAAKKLLPFQTLSHRARKSVSLDEVKISVCVFAFDLLYLNGESLINEPYKKRRQILHENFTPKEGAFVFATYKNIIPGEGEVSDIQPFLEEAVANQCEGLMVKTYDAQSEYLPNQRSYNWLKIKKDYMVNEIK